MSETNSGVESASGMSPAEAQTVHKYMVSTTVIYVGIAVVAHLLMWIYRPWFM